MCCGCLKNKPDRGDEEEEGALLMNDRSPSDATDGSILIPIGPKSIAHSQEPNTNGEEMSPLDNQKVNNVADLRGYPNLADCLADPARFSTEITKFIKTLPITQDLADLQWKLTTHSVFSNPEGKRTGLRVYPLLPTELLTEENIKTLIEHKRLVLAERLHSRTIVMQLNQLHEQLDNEKSWIQKRALVWEVITGLPNFSLPEYGFMYSTWIVFATVVEHYWDYLNRNRILMAHHLVGLLVLVRVLCSLTVSVLQRHPRVELGLDTSTGLLLLYTWSLYYLKLSERQVINNQHLPTEVDEDDASPTRCELCRKHSEQDMRHCEVSGNCVANYQFYSDTYRILVTSQNLCRYFWTQTWLTVLLSWWTYELGCSFGFVYTELWVLSPLELIYLHSKTQLSTFGLVPFLLASLLAFIAWVWFVCVVYLQVSDETYDHHRRPELYIPTDNKHLIDNAPVSLAEKLTSQETSQVLFLMKISNIIRVPKPQENSDGVNIILKAIGEQPARETDEQLARSG